MNVEAVFANDLGKKLTVTGPDGGECTAVAHKLEQAAGAPIVYGDAAQTLYNAPHDVYDVYKYSPGMVAPRGAVLTYKPNWPSIGTGPAGHTAAVTNADANITYIIEQNYPTGAPVRATKRGYDGVDGWFIPKSLNQEGAPGMTPTEIAEIRLKQLGKKDEQIAGLIALAEARRVQIDQLTAQINEVIRIAEVRLSQLNADDAQIQADQKALADLKDQLAKAQAQPAEDTQLLNSMGEVFVKLIARFGVKAGQ